MLLCAVDFVFCFIRLRRVERSEPLARRTPMEWWSSGSPNGTSPSFADHLR